MKNNKNSFTLLELIMVCVILSLVVMAGLAFNVGSQYFFFSSQRSSNIQNEFYYVLAHFKKYIGSAVGDSSNLGIVLPGGGSDDIAVRSAHVTNLNTPDWTPDDYSDNLWVAYRSQANDLQFCPNWDSSANSCNTNWEVLTSKVNNPPDFAILGPNEVQISDFVLMYDPTSSCTLGTDCDMRTNPAAGLYDKHYNPYNYHIISLAHSIN